MKKRLQVILAHAGIASRRKAVEIITQGRVRVNGIVVREKGFQSDLEKDRIEIDGRPIGFEKKAYIILNKPKGVITTASDEKGRKTVLDLVPRIKLRIYPVGRLDKDTEGVLLLTNDGDLAHRLTHPRFGAKKIYNVEVKGEIRPSDIKRLEKGIYLDGKKTAPCKIYLLKQTEKKVFLKIELHEGKKRQIRRIIEKVDCSVVRLQRIDYAGLTLKNLPLGTYRYLSDSEVNTLKERILS